MSTDRQPACQICRHPERARIEARRISGASLRSIERAFSVGKDAVSRHMTLHLSVEKKRALTVGPAQIEDLVVQAAKESKTQLEYLTILRSLIFNKLLAACEGDDFSSVAKITNALTNVLRDIGTLTGELRQVSGITFNQTNNIAVFSSPEFQALQNFLLKLARNHPATRVEILAFLRNAESPVPVINKHSSSLPAPIQIEGSADAA
jgi:hypothetical protein